jgi:hypothetical protein
MMKWVVTHGYSIPKNSTLSYSPTLTQQYSYGILNPDEGLPFLHTNLFCIVNTGCFTYLGPFEMLNFRSRNFFNQFVFNVKFKDFIWSDYHHLIYNIETEYLSPQFT